MDWAHALPTLTASFLASVVEGVEALTVVLAVGATRGWRPALVGTGLGVAGLALVVLALGPALTRIPIRDLQVVVGFLLLLFGMRWLRKAILRSAGVIALHDEAAVYSGKSAQLQGVARVTDPKWDAVAISTAFEIVMLEGMEVVFIVIAVGAAGGTLVPASIGAAAALLLVVLLGASVRAPLARIPENALKFAVGVLLSGFGTFWLGEGIGVDWPGDDLALLVLVAWFFGVALLAVRFCRLRRTVSVSAG
ncbi:MAG TPA: hypothetical protein VMG55_22020 [Stellaceae bacterium]|nr:hypothetical protein [Stellaceae bacterium]